MAVEKNFVNKLFDVKGKVALITGATGALGRAICFGYGFAGMKIMVTGRKNDTCKALCDELEAAGIECGYTTGDPAEEADVIKVIGINTKIRIVTVKVILLPKQLILFSIPKA